MLKFVVVRCSEGRVQTVRQLTGHADIDNFLRRYKARVAAVHAGPGGNPDCTQAWLDGLVATIEDRYGNDIGGTNA